MIVQGVPSGDGECWCFLVDKETFKRIRGKNPGKYDVGRCEKGTKYRYMVNPHDLLGWDSQGKLLEIKIEVTVL